MHLEDRDSECRIEVHRRNSLITTIDKRFCVLHCTKDVTHTWRDTIVRRTALYKLRGASVQDPERHSTAKRLVVTLVRHPLGG